MGKNITLIEFLSIFTKRIKIIYICVFCSLIISGTYIATSAKIYKSESRILPPTQKFSTASMVMSQLGDVANIAGSIGTTSGQMLMGILRSQSVIDRIIDRFDLMVIYKENYRLKMREFVASNILHVTEDVRSSIVTIAVLDEDPVRAAQMANAFVEELKNVMQSLAIGEAAQRRLFFERQMLQMRETLDEAEDELQKYQETSGLIAMDPQVAAMVSSIADLRAQVAAKEVELSSLRTYASGNNPNLRRAESELVALRGELEKLEREQKSADGNDVSMISLRGAPQLGLEYQRKVRDVQYATAMYDMMLKQFEAAKIDESREAMVVQIIDPATPPDYKFKPRRALIVALFTLLGLCLGMLWALFAHYVESLKEDPEQLHILKEIRATFSFRRQR